MRLVSKRTEDDIDPTPERDKDVWIVVCIGCGRIRRGGRWTDEVESGVPGRSTGYCDACAERMRRDGHV